MELSIAKNFSDIPIGRYETDSDFSGEHFRDKYLKPKLEELSNGEKLVVDIREIEGYGSSFLEEAFGGLVRKGYFSSDQLQEKLKIKDDEIYAIYTRLIWKYIKEAGHIKKQNNASK